MGKSYDDYERSSFGGWPYNSRGDEVSRGGRLVPALDGAGNGRSMGTKPAAGTIGLGLAGLKQPTSMGPAQRGPVVGPDPLARGGQGPSLPMSNSFSAGNFGATLSPQSGMFPGGPMRDPVLMPNPIQPRPFGPIQAPPGLLSGGPNPIQRGTGFGQIRPLSSY